MNNLKKIIEKLRLGFVYVCVCVWWSDTTEVVNYSSKSQAKIKVTNKNKDIKNGISIV